MLNYISTRGQSETLNFEDAMLTGLATDGGLYVPEKCPLITPQGLTALKDKSYVDIAHRVIFPFVQGCIDDGTLYGLLQETYGQFHHDDVTPIKELGEHFWVMELFHGPTLAFKDVALQFLARMFDLVLAKKGQRLTIVGATSGDTGSAAIEACKNRENLDVFILHPKDRVSDVQRRQMTTVDAPNIYNIAIEGSFDDCQDMVKAMFNDHTVRQELQLAAINSINWARIVAQVVYYVYAYAKLQDKVDELAFSVPTGNFGNVYAGYTAKSMGVPISKLMVGTNTNDILHRFFTTGQMKQEGVVSTLSPSMDIQISSNFERLLFDLYGRDPEAVQKTMTYFREQGPYQLDGSIMDRVRDLFDSQRLDDEQTKKIIEAFYQHKDYLLDPHTAVGIGSAKYYQSKYPKAPIITLSTAHPAKFPDAVEAASGVRPELPDWLSDLHQKEERYEVLPNDYQAVCDYIRAHAAIKKAA